MNKLLWLYCSDLAYHMKTIGLLDKERIPCLSSTLDYIGNYLINKKGINHLLLLSSLADEMEYQNMNIVSNIVRLPAVENLA